MLNANDFFFLIKCFIFQTVFQSSTLIYIENGQTPAGEMMVTDLHNVTVVLVKSSS